MSVTTPRFLFLLIFFSLSTLEGHAQTPVPSRNPPIPQWQVPERVLNYSVKVSKQAGFEPAKKDTNGPPGCSLLTQRSRPLLNPIPFNMLAVIVERAVLSVANRDSSADLVQFRGGIRRGAKSAFVADEKEKPEGFIPLALRVFNNPPVNSLDCCDAVVAECLISLDCVTKESCDILQI